MFAAAHDKDMIRRAAFTSALLLLLSTGSVSAASRQVDIDNFVYMPTPIKVALGDGVHWRNLDNVQHTATATKFGLWSRSVSGGQTSTDALMSWAGTHAYFCAIHPDMRGKVKVKMRATPTSTTTTGTVSIRWALVTGGSGFVYDVQRRRAGQAFTSWRTGTTSQSAAFSSMNAGTFEFRARLRNTSSGQTSGWSPVLSVRVTN